MAELSKSQVDKLGERLRQGPPTDADLQMLDEFRRSFGSAFQSVIQTLTVYSSSPFERAAKSTASIVAKLRRQDIRLSRMQDIAGCRIIVKDVVVQNSVVEALQTDFPAAKISDRRLQASHGYRAVHVIPQVGGNPIEIQIRTALQHLWAEVSEKASNVFDPAIKYGGGPSEIRAKLMQWSRDVPEYERIEAELIHHRQALEISLSDALLSWNLP